MIFKYTSKSDIGKVRDQLFVDSAEGKYLNVLSANAGMNRPVIGFRDSVWRAIVKQVGIDYKQIASQFRNVLTIIFGPRVTQTGTLASAASANDTSLFLNDTKQFPQVGTLVIDAGALTEETVEYELIDRNTNEVFLNAPLLQAHSKTTLRDFEIPILAIKQSSVILPNLIGFPTTGFPYTMVLGRGTPAEEIVQVASISATNKRLTLASPISNTHVLTKPSLINATLAVELTDITTDVYLSDVSKFPSSGYILIGKATEVNTATAGTTSTVTVVSTAFPISVAGYSAVFDGNITPSLANVSRDVLSNTHSVLTFSENLPIAPAVGDTFSIRARVEYVDINYDNSSLSLRTPIYGYTFAVGSGIEYLLPGSTASLATVQYLKSSWDLYQTKPREVDLIIPDDLQIPGDPRTASFIHGQGIDPNPEADVELSHSGSGDLLDLPNNYLVPVVGDTATFPEVGVLKLVLTSQLLGYYLTKHAALSPSIVDDSITFDSNGGVGPDTITRLNGSFIDDGFIVGQFIVIGGAAEAANNAEVRIDAVSASTLQVSYLDITDHFSDDVGDTGVTIVTHDLFIFPNDTPNSSAYALGASVELYAPVYPGTSLLIGDPTEEDAVWPGPYVYKQAEPRVNGFETKGTLDSLLSGPTKIVFTQESTNTSFEVENALSFPLAPSLFPYPVIVGKDTGNFENLNATSVSIRNRVNASSYTLDADVSAGDTELVLNALTAVSDGSSMPIGIGYRVIVGLETANKEVVYVTDVDPGTKTLTFATPCLLSHDTGDSVQLAADVVSVEESGDDHRGMIEEVTFRSSANSTVDQSLHPSMNSIDIEKAETVSPIYTSLGIIC